MGKKKVTPIYRPLRWLVKTVYPKIEAVEPESLPDEPVILVGNHSQLHGPISCEFYAPGEHYTWCAGEMMALKEVPGYAFKDFWSQKPRYTHWFYRLASYIIAPLSVLVFNNANTIGVYRDARILSTFKSTVEHLQEGENVVIFPEEDIRRNHVVYQFQERFVDVARLYYRRTGRELAFVPMYIAPKLKKMYFGEPIRFNAESPIEEERTRICEYLMDAITEIAEALPEHTVVPYRNIPKKLYPSNKLTEEENEEARS